MPLPCRWSRPCRPALQRTWEQVTEMKPSNRVLNLALKGRGFGRAAEPSFFIFRAGFSPIGAIAREKDCGSSPPRLKPHHLRRTYGTPEGAPFQSKTLRRTLHALILTAAIFLFMGAGDDSARFKDL